MSRWKKILTSLLALFLLIQLVPVDRDNPPVEEEISAPVAVLAVLRRSCYDCHSQQTRWPWYSYIAPVSWLVASDVQRARDHVNFSLWNRLSAKDRAEAIEQIGKEVEDGNMPLPTYVLAHPDAALSDQDRQLLIAWAEAADRDGGRGRGGRDGGAGIEPEPDQGIEESGKRGQGRGRGRGRGSR